MGALALVAAIAAGFVAWRRLSRGDEGEDGGWKPPPDEPPEPAPTPTPEAVAA